MARIKSKEFKKQYASTMDNVPEKGVWSGRGIAIPVAGAIGGGDDYKQKIGRGKLPDFRTGRPTQGADSTWSSYLARVNTGYDDVWTAEYISDMAMFPEQEAEDEDIYDYDEPVYIGNTRKIPKNFKVKRPRIRGIREMISFKDDEIVSNSRYSVLDVFENSDRDFINEEADLASIGKGLETGASAAKIPMALKSAGKGLEIAASVASKSPGGGSSVGKSAIKFLLKAAGVTTKAGESILQAVPGLDVALTVILGTARLASLGLQYIKFSNSLGFSPQEMEVILLQPPLIKGIVTDENVVDVFDRIREMPVEERLDTREIMEGMLETLKNILIDLVEAADSIAGLFGWAGGPAGFGVAEVVLNLFTGVGGFILSVIPIESWLLRMTAGGSLKLEELLSMMVSGENARIGRPFLDMMHSKGGPIMGAVLNNPIGAFAKLGVIYRELSDPIEPDSDLMPDLPDDIFQGLPDEEEAEEAEILDPDIIDVEVEPEEEPLLTKRGLLNRLFGIGDESSTVAEGKMARKISIDELREIIRESYYPDYGSYHPPLPGGYKYRSVPVVTTQASDDSEFGILDNYDEEAVAYKTDGGVIAYQERNKLVKEAALRRIIRNDILSALEESKKKRS